jgi:hypothetical protein
MVCAAVFVWAALLCAACGGPGGSADAPVVPAPFIQKDKQTVEYHVQGRLPHLLEVRCLASYGVDNVLKAGGITPEQTSLVLNRKKLARAGVFVEVRRGGVKRREYPTWELRHGSRITLKSTEGLSSRQVGQLSREQLLTKLNELGEPDRRERELEPSDLVRGVWRDTILHGEIVVRLGRWFDPDFGIPDVVVKSRKPAQAVVHLTVRPAAEGGLRIETPLGDSKCSSTVPRRPIPSWY